MAQKKMGFEGKIFYGAAGSTASAEITNSRDISYNMDAEKADTTTRGDGSGPSIVTERVVALPVSIEWTMLNKVGDTSLEALRVAAYAGLPVAIRTQDHASGKGYDGDVVLSVSHGVPYRGEQTYQFTATPNDDQRTPQTYV